jgi:hypothetical protein
MRAAIEKAELRKQQMGFALVAFLIISFFAALIVGGTLELLSANTKMIGQTKINENDQLAVESAFNQSLAWLKENSKNMLYPFTASSFYSEFTRSKPSIGDNDVVITVPTKVKIKGSNYTPLISNVSDLGKPIFPASKNTDTGVKFDVISSFQKLKFADGVIVKLSLIDAIPVDPAQDFGPPPGKAAATSFKPIYRIDATDSADRNRHIYGYVVGSILEDTSQMFIGDKTVTVNGVCDAYDSTKGSYGKANRLAKCSMGSAAILNLNKAGTVYGEVASNKTLKLKGMLCSDFDAGCPNTGSKCVGASCAVPSVDKLDPWKKYCPKDQGDLVISNDTTLEVLSDVPTSSCWNKITIKKKVSLTLKTTKYPYYINNIEFEHGTNSKLVISPSSSAAPVLVYLEKITGKRPGQFDGTRIINSTANPRNFRLWYLGNGNLKLTRKDSIYAELHAHEAKVSISGNLDFYGAIFSSQIVVGKNARLHGDQSLSVGSAGVNDVSYDLRQINAGLQ